MKTHPKKKRDPNTPIRYILYVRKSTESEDRQVKSLDDQISECMAFAERNGLNVVAKLRESGSAKTSNNRPIFNKMLEDIKAGKFDGILAWHPDRLARNMLESGKIIDLLDNGIIRDLKFPTVAFTSDASGKMLLGMMFVMSKQYSEHLSESVLRGVTSNLEQGKSGGQYKWGYVRNDEGYYEPDENFEYIKQAWKMRLNGSTNREISKYLKDHDVHRIAKASKKRYEVNAHTLTNIFHDSFYFGILIQASKEVDLRDYGNFKPMITEDEYNAVQEINYTTPKAKASRKKRVAYFPLAHGFVHCGVCGGVMTPEASKGKAGTKYLYYRCHDKNCTRNVKGIRGNIIFDAMYAELDHLKFTDKEYERYLKTVDRYSDEILGELRKEKMSLAGTRTNKQKTLDGLSDNYIAVAQSGNETVKKRLSKQIDALTSEVADLDSQIDEINDKLNNSKKAIVSRDEFLNTLNMLADKMRAGDVVEKDILARKMLSNTIIDDKNSPSFIWKEPFATLIKLSKIQLGWG